MKHSVLGLLALSMAACVAPVRETPPPSPNRCPRCGEIKTLEIIHLGPAPNDHNRRCSRCNHTWHCIGCWTDPFWRR